MLNLAHFKDDSSPNGTLSLFVLENLMLKKEFFSMRNLF